MKVCDDRLEGWDSQRREKAPLTPPAKVKVQQEKVLAGTLQQEKEKIVILGTKTS